MDELTHVVQQVSGSGFREALQQASRWPPDLFALTSAILGKTGAYRMVVSPCEGLVWPPRSSHPLDYHEHVRALAEEWRESIGSSRSSVAPSEIASRIAELERDEHVALTELDLPEQWQTLCRLLFLHALADEACEGLGLNGPGTELPHFYLRAGMLLTERGSLSNFPTTRIRVLPKTRTAQAGITLRSLSHHVAIDTSEVEVRWERRRHPGGLDDKRRLRLLVFPWPLSLHAHDFRPMSEAKQPKIPLDSERFGFFEFAPSYARAALLDAFRDTVRSAMRQFSRIDAVVLPEAAVTEPEFEDLWVEAKREGLSMLLSGVRGDGMNEAWLRIEGGERVDTFRQPKHHRWFLDESQIRTYGVGHTLHPSKKWWEAMDIGRRSLNVVVLNDWLALCHLICEDLARIDPVSQCLRAMGPNLILALLMDGPQLVRRWPGRYATVFADDPGSSVLTVTSLGMALLSRPAGTQPEPIVALWKDSIRGDVEIKLQPDAQGIVLTLWAEAVEEFTSDGRSDGGTAARLVLGGIQQILPA